MMSRFGHKKEKHGKSSELSLHNCNEGTAARTRPLSFDEIMNRRIKKNLSKDVKEGVVDVGNIPGTCTIENVSDYRESKGRHRHNKGSSPGVAGHVLEEIVKVRSGKKKDNSLTQDSDSSRRKDRESHESETKFKDDKSSKSKHIESRESEIRLKNGSLGKERDRGSRGSITRLKSEITKENFSEAKGTAEKLIPGQEKIHERSIDDSKDGTRKKHSRDLTVNDRHVDETRKKHSGDLVGKDRYVDRSGEKSERESKRKHRSVDDEKNRDKSAAKKVDMGKGHVLEVSERKERKESLKSRYEESRPKRRRSRSRECEDRNRRSISLSPRTQKSTPYQGREHDELPSHSSKGRSGRHHSDIDKKVASNGSNNHYGRHGGSTSGLGGYSPRKRRTEAAVKTPSPVNRSPEKKSAKWDIAPLQMDSVPSNVQMSNQAASSVAHDVVSSIPVTSTTRPLTGISLGASMEKLNASINSVQLTQATRPMRRLYVENVPASASEKALIEFLNNILLSSGVNHIHGSLPCISCVIQREKGQALVEFLTAEDASAVLSCDGCSFSGSILKFRRPKDFVEVASGKLEKSVASVDSISDIVKDSPHKIFIGGISKTLSSKLVMEIASAFGSLKAYHFEANEDRQELCAFIEYVDQSVTLKACAGLNGMKVGGQVLTVVQAVPDGSTLEYSGNPPFYGIPKHALPLLKKPTQVIKLKNVFNPEGFSSLSELELEEVLEDVRSECARFGTVQSVNVVKHEDSHITTTEACQTNENLASAGVRQNLMSEEKNEKEESLEDVADHKSTGHNELEFPSEAKEIKELVEGNSIDVNEPENDIMGDEPRQLGKLDSNMAVEGLARENTSETFPQDVLEQLNALKDDPCPRDDNVACNTQMDDTSVENKLSAEEMNLEEVGRTSPEARAGLDGALEMQSDVVENGLGHIFEVGCVFVEYRRAEASCMAAHNLHGRLFDDRIVTVEYIPLDLYRARFPK